MDFSAGLVQRGFNEVNWPENSVKDGLNVRVGPEGISSGMSHDTVHDFGAGSKIRNIWQADFALDGLTYLVVAVDKGDSTKIYASLNFNSEDPQFHQIHDYEDIAGDLTAACVNDRFIINYGKLSGPLVFAGGLSEDGSDWSSMRQALMSDDGENFYGVGDELVDTDRNSFVSLSGMNANGGLYVCDEKTGLTAFVIGIDGAANPGCVLKVEYWHGTGWSAVTGMIDGTNGLTKNGIVSFDAVDVRYGEVGGLAGFWYRARLEGYNGSELKIVRMRLKSGVAPLANIGSGIDDIAMGFIYYDASVNSWKDYSLEVADSTQITFARLNDGAAENPVGMGPDDFVYIGGIDEFLNVKIEFERNHSNLNNATLSAEYWNGSSWTAVGSFVDGTTYDGKTFNQSGYLRFTCDNWKPRRIGAVGSLGYWLRLKVNAYLTAATYVCEVRVLSKPKPLGMYRLVCALRDRLALIGRSDAPDQIDISREGEEYGFNGDDSCSVRIGGQGPITAAVEAFNQLWVCKGSEWYMLNGYNPATFAIERAETSSQTPAAHYSIVSAPIKLSDGINRHGLYFVNQSGVWNFTGLQVNSITDFVNWFEGGDVNAVADVGVVGLFNAAKYELWWRISFIDEAGNAVSRIIVYDLGRQTWNCPFETDAEVICGVRFVDGAGSNSRGVVLGGTGDGRLVMLDEGPDDNKTRSCQTGWINFKSPEWEKRIHGMRIFGQFEGDLTVSLSRDGMKDKHEAVFRARNGENEFDILTANECVEFNFLKMGFEWTGPGLVNGVLFEIAWDRNRPLERGYEDG